MSPSGLLFLAAACCGCAFSQTATNATYKLSLPNHNGEMQWSAEGFHVVQNSAKDDGREIGLRARNASGSLSLLAFLFLVPEDAPLTSAKCRDGALGQEKQSRPGMKILSTSEISSEGGSPVAIASYTSDGRGGSLSYTVRGFLASGELCGDLEFDSAKPIDADDYDLKQVFSTYRLDPNYAPQFSDIVLYAQILYQTQKYRASAAMLEKALEVLPPNGAPFASAQIAKRVVTDQAGLAYGMAGDFTEARAIFQKALAQDPAYPMYYYNLACADAGQKKLADARLHLQQAFARKSNLNPGETMPDPTRDDSFTPYRADKLFWAFLEELK